MFVLCFNDQNLVYEEILQNMCSLIKKKLMEVQETEGIRENSITVEISKRPFVT